MSNLLKSGTHCAHKHSCSHDHAHAAPLHKHQLTDFKVQEAPPARLRSGEDYSLFRKPRHKESALDEVCPCCVVLDLDEVVGLTKLDSVGAVGSGTHAGLPDTSAAWTIAGLTAYLAGAGLYFGWLNFTGSHRRLQQLKEKLSKLEPVCADLKARLEKTPANSRMNHYLKTRLNHIESYLGTIRYSKLDGRFQKWGAGFMPGLGSALMIGGIFFSPLTIPALIVMTLYAKGHAIKYGYDWHRMQRADLKKIPIFSSGSLSDKGVQVFKKRFSEKRNFLRAIIPVWLSYGAGTAFLSALAISAIAGVVFPPALIATGAVLLVGGVIGALYLNNTQAKRFAPKNLDEGINRQWLGSDKQLAQTLGYHGRQTENSRQFERQVMHGLNLKRLTLMRLKQAGYWGFFVMSLGVLPGLQRLKHHIEKYKIKGASHSIEDARLSFMKAFIENRLEYLQARAKSLQKETEAAAEQRQIILLQEMQPLLENKPGTRHEWLKLMHRFLWDSNLLDPVMKEFFKEIRANVKKYEANSLLRKIEHKEHVHHHHHNHHDNNHCCEHHAPHDSEYEIDIDELCDQMAKDNSDALRLYHKFCQVSDHYVLNHLQEDFDYKLGALADHWEQMLRSFQQNDRIEGSGNKSG